MAGTTRRKREYNPARDEERKARLAAIERAGHLCEQCGKKNKSAVTITANRLFWYDEPARAWKDNLGQEQIRPNDEVPLRTMVVRLDLHAGRVLCQPCVSAAKAEERVREREERRKMKKRQLSLFGGVA